MSLLRLGFVTGWRWVLALSVGFLGTPALAGQLNRSVIGELLQGGWTVEDRDPSVGLVVSSKPLKSVGLTAYMGVRDLPASVDPERLWKLVAEVGKHDDFAPRLAESTVVKRHGAAIDFYQVLKPPPLVSSAQRFWFVHTELETNLGGVQGHHRRCWSKLSEAELPEARADVAKRYPSAMEVALTHGCWEVLPAGDDGTPARLRYRTVSDPGGSLPASLAAMLTSRALPENLAAFVRQAGG